MKTAEAEAVKRKRRPMTRIDARISRGLKDKIEHAAYLRDQSVTDFLTGALDEAASRVIMEDAPIKLHVEDQMQLAEAILSDKPFPPVEKMARLRQAAKEYANVVTQK